MKIVTAFSSSQLLALFFTFHSSHGHLSNLYPRSNPSAAPPPAEAVHANQQAVLSRPTKEMVSSLWTQVQQLKPVQQPAQKTVVDTPSYIDIGPDPQKDNRFTAKTYTTSRIDHLKFPKGFLHGVAISAAQTEGAVQADGRGPSIWDSFAHLNDTVPAPDTFDVATNFRHLYPLDIARVKSMGISAFSFSISWSRVIPMGYGEVSHEGLQFYIDLVEEIKRHGLLPVATLFHWDLPLQLEVHYGGLANEQFVSDFVRFAEVMFKALGPCGVETWFTFNEPQTFCQQLPFIVQHVHATPQPDRSLPWKCAGNVIQAHGRTWELFRTLRTEGTLNAHAQLSYKNAGTRSVPFRANNKDDKDALTRFNDFGLALFAEPIHKTGQYPDVVRQEVPSDWLPVLTLKDKDRIRGSVDFIATNFFAANIVKATEREGGYRACLGNLSHPAWPSCTDYTESLPDGQLMGERADPSAPTLFNSAGMLRAHLKALYDDYPSRGGLYLTAIGWAERGEGNKTSIDDVRHDDGRQRYLHDHLAEMLLAIYKDGVPLRGVFFWSATSSIEWTLGRALHFGLQSVDYSSANLTRTYLGSFFFLKHFFATHQG